MPGSLTRQMANLRPRLVALLLFLLLFVQTMMLMHPLHLDEHPGGEPCELCLHLSLLDHGLTTTQPLPQLPRSAPPPEIRTWLQAITPRHTTYDSRAPPRSIS